MNLFNKIQSRYEKYWIKWVLSIFNKNYRIEIINNLKESRDKKKVDNKSKEKKNIFKDLSFKNSDFDVWEKTKTENEINLNSWVFFPEQYFINNSKLKLYIWDDTFEIIKTKTNKYFINLSEQQSYFFSDNPLCIWEKESFNWCYKIVNWNETSIYFWVDIEWNLLIKNNFLKKVKYNFEFIYQNIVEIMKNRSWSPFNTGDYIYFTVDGKEKYLLNRWRDVVFERDECFKQKKWELIIDWDIVYFQDIYWDVEELFKFSHNNLKFISKKDFDKIRKQRRGEEENFKKQQEQDKKRKEQKKGDYDDKKQRRDSYDWRLDGSDKMTFEKSLLVLEINHWATKEDAKKAYRRLAKEYHPDKHQNKWEEEMEVFALKFKELKKAYDFFYEKCDEKYTRE